MATQEELLKAFELTTVAYWSIFFFDYVQTLPREWTLYRKRGVSFITFVFFISRYSALTAGIVSLIQVFGHVSESTCRGIIKLPLTFALLNQLASSSLFTMRVYAIWKPSNSKFTWALPVLGLLTMIQIPAAAAVLSYMEMLYRPATATCGFVNRHVAPFPVFFGTMFLFDATAFALASYKLLSNRRSLGGKWTPVTQMLWESGLAYFAVAFLVETVGLALYIEGTPVKENMMAFGVIVFSSMMAQRIAFYHLRFSDGSMPAFPVFGVSSKSSRDAGTGSGNGRGGINVTIDQLRAKSIPDPARTAISPTGRREEDEYALRPVVSATGMPSYKLDKAFNDFRGEDFASSISGSARGWDSSASTPYMA